MHSPGSARESLKCLHVPPWAGDNIPLTCTLALHILTPFLTQTHPSASPTHASLNAMEWGQAIPMPPRPLCSPSPAPKSRLSPQSTSPSLALSRNSMGSQLAAQQRSRHFYYRPGSPQTGRARRASTWPGTGMGRDGAAMTPSSQVPPCGSGGPGCVALGANPQ